MKITIDLDEKYTETEVDIHCRQLDTETEKIIATLRMLNQQLMVSKKDENHLLDVTKIIYVEAVERKTFVYTAEDVYESKLRLYEMEERLCAGNFMRISKSCLVNLRQIKSLRNDVERKIRLTLKNGEQIVVSRQYADEMKKRLGVM